MTGDQAALREDERAQLRYGDAMSVRLRGESLEDIVERIVAARVSAAEAERDALRRGIEDILGSDIDSVRVRMAKAEAKMARVEALANEWRHDLLSNKPTTTRDLGWVQGVTEALSELDAALRPDPTAQGDDGRPASMFRDFGWFGVSDLQGDDDDV